MGLARPLVQKLHPELMSTVVVDVDEKPVWSQRKTAGSEVRMGEDLTIAEPEDLKGPNYPKEHQHGRDLAHSQ